MKNKHGRIILIDFSSFADKRVPSTTVLGESYNMFVGFRKDVPLSNSPGYVALVARE